MRGRTFRQREWVLTSRLLSSEFEQFEDSAFDFHACHRRESLRALAMRERERERERENERGVSHA